MKSVYCSNSHPRVNTEAPVASFKDAMDHYIEVISGQRVRCMQFCYNGKGLMDSIRVHFPIIRDEGTFLSFKYIGVVFNVMILEGFHREFFTLSEDY